MPAIAGSSSIAGAALAAFSAAASDTPCTTNTPPLPIFCSIHVFVPGSVRLRDRYRNPPPCCTALWIACRPPVSIAARFASRPPASSRRSRLPCAAPSPRARSFHSAHDSPASILDSPDSLHSPASPARCSASCPDTPASPGAAPSPADRSAELAQRIRADRVALIARRIPLVGVLPDVDIEVIEPEVGHHLLQLPLAQHRAHHLGLRQLLTFGRYGAPCRPAPIA